MATLALCRFAHFLAAMLTFGASAFLWLNAPARLARALSPAVRRLTLAGSVVALLTAIIWLALEAAAMADDAGAAFDTDSIGAVLLDTSFGHAWAAHLVLAAVLVAVVAFGPRTRWGATGFVSAALLGSLGLVGHAGMHTGAEGAFARANDALHLLATGAWIGALPAFLMCLSAYQRADLKAEAVEAMARFSFLGHFIVVAIVLTGAVNVAVVSGRTPIPPDSPWRALLDAKIVVVAIMIALALFNRYRLVPRLRGDARALELMRATSATELALGGAAVALVSVFALLDPN